MQEMMSEEFPTSSRKEFNKIVESMRGIGNGRASPKGTFKQMIRKLTTDDFEIWKALRLEAVKDYPESFGESYENIVEQDIKWFEQSLKNGTIFVYEKDNQIIGLVGTFSMQPGNMTHRATLFGLYVQPEQRQKGIAGELVEHVISFVAKTHKQIHLTVTTNNNAAIDLYKKHGFIIYGTEPDALYLDGKYYDEHLMLKKLEH